jgi:hypothetical protein
MTISPIPRIILLTHRTKQIPASVIATIESLYPEFTILFFDNHDCKVFLETYFSAQHAKFFTRLLLGPIKADFWRLCALYYYGGYYFDIDLVPLVNVESIIESIICTASGSRNVSFATCIAADNASIFQAFVASVPRHPVLATCIQMFIDKSKRLSSRMYSKRFNLPLYWQWSGTKDMYIALCERMQVPALVPGYTDAHDGVLLLQELKQNNDYFVLYKDMSSETTPETTEMIPSSSDGVLVQVFQSRNSLYNELTCSFHPTVE